MQDKYKRYIDINNPYSPTQSIYIAPNDERTFYINVNIRSTSGKPFLIAYVSNFDHSGVWNTNTSMITPTCIRNNITFKNEKNEIYDLSTRPGYGMSIPIFILGNVALRVYYEASHNWKIISCHDTNCELANLGTTGGPTIRFNYADIPVEDHPNPYNSFETLCRYFEDIKDERFATEITIQWKLGIANTYNQTTEFKVNYFTSNDIAKICLYSLDPNNIEVSTPTYSRYPVI